ncbi:hypothetical protein Pcinc_006877 [Petrolisthes cinctipes]|uniref:Uncharacterized protein n=1 Tax=Petrolisthes cinctipes TaxID=88211 RepID=A0AAE1GC24_PETCI|nr:hypothetical protein Pcinc_006877 [Petrolisthes cinctipes]
MDSSLLKTMLESQERAYKAAMEIVVKQMNDQIKKLEGKVSDLTVSLEFTQREVDELKTEIKEQTKSSHEKMKQLEERINYQEDYSRKKNVRISGVEERDGNETWEQSVKTVTSLLQDKLQLEGLELERAHRVGVRRDAKPRTIVARFSRYCDREAAMRNARKLKGTNIFLDDDLCPASQAIKNAQMPQLKQAKAQGKVAFFRRTKLIIRERYNVGAAAGRGQQPTGVTDKGTAASVRGQQTVGDAGAVGGVERGARGSAQSGSATDRGVVDVQVAGTWSDGKEEGFPSLPTPHSGVSRLLSHSASGASPQRKQDKITLRSSVKK